MSSKILSAPDWMLFIRDEAAEDLEVFSISSLLFEQENVKKTNINRKFFITYFLG